MDGLTRLYIFKQKQHCEPFDLSRFVVDIRESHLEYWTPSYSETHPREHNSKRSTTYHHWCALPTKRALSLICCTSFWNICFLTFLIMPFAVQLTSNSVLAPAYVLTQRHGTKVTPLPVTCGMLMIFKISSMSFFTASIPTCFSPQNKCISVPPNRSLRCVYFWARITTKSFLFPSMN